MANINKISENMKEYSDHVLHKLDEEISELKKTSVAVAVDKVISKKFKK